MTTSRTASRPIDRLPAHSPEAEQGTLGCILLSPNECMCQCVERLAGIESFYDLRHQTIYDGMLSMWDAREAIDVVTLQQHLKDKQILDQVGGVTYLSTLPDQINPSPANLPYYLDILEEKFLLRRMVRVCTEAVTKVYDNEGDVHELLDSLERDILAIRSARNMHGDVPIKELITQAINEIEEDHKNQGKLSGIETGFHDFDKLTSGLQRSEMIVIAARPSMGKTSLAMNIVDHVSATLKLPVGVFSLEMSDRSLAKRLLCSRARVNIRAAKDGFLADRDFPKLTGARDMLSHAPLFINDTGGLPIGQLRAKARRWHREHGIKLLVIDYLQLIQSSQRHDSRQQEVTEISSGVKNLAKELEIPVIVLSQLNREVEKRKHSRPVMSDLRESGAIEQDADLIGFLYQPPAEDPSDEEQSAIAINLFIAKQRNGPTGVDVNLMFIKGFTRFESAAKVSQEDLPQNNYRPAYVD